jgi:hypothetical protein
MSGRPSKRKALPRDSMDVSRDRVNVSQDRLSSASDRIDVSKDVLSVDESSPTRARPRQPRLKQSSNAGC